MGLTYEELRIGNLVYFEKEIHEVTGIILNKCVYVNGVKCDIKDVEGVPITEQILIDFGFRSFYKEWLYEWHSGHLELIQSKMYWKAYLCDYPLSSGQNDQYVQAEDLKYFHEVQNLYFEIRKEWISRK